MAKITKNFDIKTLTEDQQKSWQYWLKRKLELKQSRKKQFGSDIEQIWRDADRDYIPHTIKGTGKKAYAEYDESLGWRGSMVEIGGTAKWQSDISQPNPYIKIQTALAIMIDKNPTAVFNAGSKKFEATTEIIKQLYQRNWEVAKSKQQLKLFVFNMAKYGWACARTYPLKITRKVKNITQYNENEPEKSVWEDKEVVEYNDVFRENLDVWNTWIDDMALPNNQMSVNDWCYRKVYNKDVAEDLFSGYKNWELAKNAQAITTEKVDGQSDIEYTDKNLVEVYFYENRAKDLYVLAVNDVPLIIEPLPVSDSSGVKRLSLWQAPWNLRHSQCPYGIGLYEAIRGDQLMLDKIRNMTIDQLTLSIYKMGFYSGTQALTETGDIKIKPGTMKQTLDPKNITWMEVPGPGRDAWEGMVSLKKDIDDASGIGEALMGKITGKTAFEISQAKESGLARLKTPLDNICDALDQDAYITIALIQLIYSVPEVIKITDTTLIDDYLKEIKSDPTLYKQDETGAFEAQIYREFPLNLDEDDQGNLYETEQSRFLRIKPEYLKWEGIISVKAQSVLTPSKQLDKALELELYNILVPLLGQTAQEYLQKMASGVPPKFDDLTYGKSLKSIIKLYDKDPRDILPDEWTQEKPQQPQPLIVPQGGQVPATGQPATPQSIPQPTQPMASPTLPQQPQGLVGKLVSKMSAPFRKV